MLAHVKDLSRSRDTCYECISQSQQIRERAPLTLVSLAIKINFAMQEVGREQGLPSTLSPSQRSKLLEQVTGEFNSYGVVSLNASYALSRHQQVCLNNLLLHASPLVLQEIQACLDVVPEKRRLTSTPRCRPVAGSSEGVRRRGQA